MHNNKEFRISDYVCLFEKSLNYMTGAILSMFAVNIINTGSNSDWALSLEEILGIIDNDPKDLFCILIAVISTLPYYFYYTLKDNTDWNACNGSKDNWGLLKIYILYEIGIFSFFYLILQGDVHFSFAKFIISIINIVLIFIYLILLFIENKNKSRDRIGYFIAVIFLAIVFFLVLSINSFYKFKEHSDSQNYITLLLLILFSGNAGINIFFLTMWDSSEEVGIISNRIKIMIPVISIALYTVSTIYCYLVFTNEWQVIVTIAWWITLYEVAVSCIKIRDSRKKVIRCIVLFLIFVFGIPILLKIQEYTNMLKIQKVTKLPVDLGLKWLILVGMSIYIAAIKYWGYILKFLFIDKDQKKSKIKTMSVMVWFRNSILGSMLFISIILISSGYYYISLIAIIICSLIAEHFISKYAFKDYRENSDKLYVEGRLIEFIAIMMPLIILAIENHFKFKYEGILQFGDDLPKSIELIIAALSIFAIILYIEVKWKQNDNCKEKQSALSVGDVKQLFGKIPEFTKKIELIVIQVLPDRNRESFMTILITWSSYAIIVAVILEFFSYSSIKRILGLSVTATIFIVDWFFLSKYLFNYYISKMKEGKHMMRFKSIFEKEWKNCLNTLNEFNEIAADQFKGGDRLRPFMFFLGSSYKRSDDLVDRDYVDIAKVACSLELIHKSSVMFDDFIDKDDLRKGVQTFHKQYPDIDTMILLGNAMLAKAQINFTECRNVFKCSEKATIDNVTELAQIILDLCIGCHKELSRATCGNQDKDETKRIIYLETVSLIKGSIELGYRCFHEDQGHEDLETIKKLGEAFGYIFQYLNDLEPFSQRLLYERHKGEKSNFDYDRNSIALVTLREKVQGEEKNVLNNPNYNNILKLYQKYEIEQTILGMVKEEIIKTNNLLEKLNAGDEKWVNIFKAIFNYALEKKGWGEKIPFL